MRFMWLSVAAALATMALKSLAAWLTGSVGLLSDALESGVNLVAAIVGLLALRLAAKPADFNHDFGHGKAEYLSAAVEGALIFVAAGAILWTSIDRLIDPAELDQPGIGLALSLVANGQEMNSKYFDLRLTNTGSEPCDLLGHPGVSLLDAGGKRVGEPATRSQDGTGDGGPVRLRPGQAAHATVKTAGEGVTDGRCWPEAATLLVYPPGSKQTVTTGDLAGLKVCGDSFQVGPVGDRAP